MQALISPGTVPPLQICPSPCRLPYQAAKTSCQMQILPQQEAQQAKQPQAQLSKPHTAALPAHRLFRPHLPSSLPSQGSLTRIFLLLHISSLRKIQPSTVRLLQQNVLWAGRGSRLQCWTIPLPCRHCSHQQPGGPGAGLGNGLLRRVPSCLPRGSEQCPPGRLLSLLGDGAASLHGGCAFVGDRSASHLLQGDKADIVHDSPCSFVSACLPVARKDVTHAAAAARRLQDYEDPGRLVSSSPSPCRRSPRLQRLRTRLPHEVLIVICVG